MNLSFLGPFHPQIVYTPIVMLIFSAFFALGRPETVTDLPKSMINRCYFDYNKLKRSFDVTIYRKHVDPELAKQVLATKWFW